MLEDALRALVDGEEDEREHAATRLAGLNQPQAVKPLIAALDGDASERVRAEAALARIGPA
jgi:HEAT repeat protein